MSKSDPPRRPASPEPSHSSRPTHFDDEGRPRMVDVSDKEETRRTAAAEGALRMRPETLEALLAGAGPKGDPLQVARIAGIQAGKRTGEWIPLCHVLPAVSLEVEVEPDPDLPGLRVRSRASLRGSTGVEMEALTAASAALLTLYDMLKALDRGMVLEGIRLLRKEGGRSGTWRRDPETDVDPAEAGHSESSDPEAHGSEAGRSEAGSSGTGPSEAGSSEGESPEAD